MTVSALAGLDTLAKGAESLMISLGEGGVFINPIDSTIFRLKPTVGNW